MAGEKYFGLLTSISWNSNKFAEAPAPEDLKSVKNREEAFYSALNFKYETDEANKLTVYYPFLPQLSAAPPKSDDLKNIKVIYVSSKEPESGIDYLVGLYAFPSFFSRSSESPFPEMASVRSNLQVLGSNMHLLQPYLEMSAVDKKLIPNYNTTGKKKYIYLAKNQVEPILDILTKSNPGDSRLHGIKFRLLKSMM